jgi:hypothetical protein
VPLDVMAAGGPPAIETLEVKPLGGTFAPATFRISSKVKNADLCILALGDERPLEVNAAPAENFERMVTFRKPGTHKIKLVAVSGKHTQQKQYEVQVASPPPATAMAILQVTQEVIPVDKITKLHNIPVAFPAKFQVGANHFKIERDAEPGYHIIDAKFAKPVAEKHIKNPKLEISSDRRKVKFTGEIVKPGGFIPVPRTTPVANAVVEVALTQERHEQPVKRPTEVSLALAVPGSTVLPLPSLPDNWMMKERSLGLELKQGDKTAWQDSKLPQNASLQLQNRTYRVTAIEQGNQVKLDIVEVRKPGTPSGN